jgi:hypothetical protein
MERRLPADAVERLVNEWRTRKVNAMMAMVTNLIQKSGKTPSLVQDGVPEEMSSDTPETVASELAAA